MRKNREWYANRHVDNDVVPSEPASGRIREDATIHMQHRKPCRRVAPLIPSPYLSAKHEVTQSRIPVPPYDIRSLFSPPLIFIMRVSILVCHIA